MQNGEQLTYSGSVLGLRTGGQTYACLVSSGSAAADFRARFCCFPRCKHVERLFLSEENLKPPWPFPAQPCWEQGCQRSGEHRVL